MKILDITPYYHKNSGGIKTYLNYKVQWLANKRVEHVVVIPGRTKRNYQVGASRFYEVPSIKLLGGYRFFRSISEINQIIELEKPNIVELGGTYLLVPFLKGKNYLLSVFYHSDAMREINLLPLPGKVKKNLLFLLLERCLAKADAVFVPSSKYERELIEFGLSNVVYSPLGIDCNLFTPQKYNPHLRELLCPQPGKVLLLYVGRLSPEKGLKTLLKTFNLLNQDKFHLVIIGRGPLEIWLKYKQKKFPNLTYLPHLKQEKLAEVYATSDIFLSASKFETFGYAFVEAEASGLPVCAFDLDLETQLLKKTLAQDNTPEALAEKINITTEILSFELREHLHERVSLQFSLEKSFSRVFQTYLNLLSHRFNPHPLRSHSFQLFLG